MSAPRTVQEAVTLRVLDITEAAGDAGPVIDAQLIRAGMSLNRNLYSADVLKAAVKRYEGAKVMLDHADGWFIPDSVRNVAAIITDPQWDKKAEAITARIHPATDLESGELLLNLARTERRFRADGVLASEGGLFGLSHRVQATGTYHEPDGEDGYYEIEDIVDVLSVDAVVFPAAGGLMRGLSESRRDQLLALLADAGIKPESSSEGSNTRVEKARRKVSIMAKQKGARAFDTDAIVVKVEGIERADIEPALQAAAQVGFDLATAEAAERITALEADKARVEGERDAAREKLGEFEAREEEARRLEAVDALIASKDVPEPARATLRERIAALGGTPEAAEALVDAYLEGLKVRREAIKNEDPDTKADTQESTADETSEVAEGFYNQYVGARPSN